MSDIKQVEEQLKRIGCNNRFWGRAEVKELANILLPDETIEQCVNGSYEGGFALLAATDQRVLLVDKKPMYLTLEDIRYDMIAEVDFNHRLLNSNIFICTPNRSLRFTGYNQAKLRKFFHSVQTKVMQVRQHYAAQAQQYQSLQSGLLQYQQQLGSAADTQALPAQAGMETQMFEQNSSMYHHPHVAPIINAYTRLPLMSRQRRFLGARALNTSMPSLYQ